MKALGIADTGASVLSAGKSIMRRMGIEEKQLCPTTTIIRVANQIKLNVLGMVPVTVQVVGHPERQTIQALYIVGCVEKLENGLFNMPDSYFYGI